MKRLKIAQGLVVALSGSLLLAAPRQAQADWFWRHPGNRHHYYGHETIVVLPTGAVPILVGDSTYYYCGGLYYRRNVRGYVVVPAPVGAVVPALPEAHQTIVIDGVTYHYYDGVYYKGGPAGYTVVPIYQGVTASATTSAIPAPSNPTTVSTTLNNTLVVNVPNKNGSYTPVTLQLANNGMYIGPQGEVYPNRPDLGQLQAMYGK